MALQVDHSVEFLFGRLATPSCLNRIAVDDEPGLVLAANHRELAVVKQSSLGLFRRSHVAAKQAAEIFQSRYARHIQHVHTTWSVLS